MFSYYLMFIIFPVVWAVVSASVPVLATDTPGSATPSTITMIIPGVISPETSREITAVKLDKLQNRIIPGYEGVHVRSIIDCLILCGEDQECMSFFYQSLSKTCYLHTIVFISWNDTDNSESTSYYIVGDDKDCPLSKGYFHKRSLKFCYQIIYEQMNITNAVRTCREINGMFGFSFDLEVHNHLIAASEGSFILRKRKFWTGMEYDEVKGEFVFQYGIAPDFGRWVGNVGTANEGTTLQPDGGAGKCVDTAGESGWNWDVTECFRKRAFVCDYLGEF